MQKENSLVQKKLKKCNSPKVEQKYLQIKKECQQEYRIAKNNLLNKICEDSNSKPFWNYIKYTKQKHHCKLNQ